MGTSISRNPVGSNLGYIYIHTRRWKERLLHCPPCYSHEVDPWSSYHDRPGLKRSWCKGCRRTFNGAKGGGSRAAFSSGPRPPPAGEGPGAASSHESASIVATARQALRSPPVTRRSLWLTQRGV